MHDLYMRSQVPHLASRHVAWHSDQRPSHASAQSPPGAREPASRLGPASPLDSPGADSWLSLTLGGGANAFVGIGAAAGGAATTARLTAPSPDTGGSEAS